MLVLGVQLLFSIRTNQPEAQIRFIQLAAHGTQARTIVINKKYLNNLVYAKHIRRCGSDEHWPRKKLFPWSCAVNKIKVLHRTFFSLKHVL